VSDAQERECRSEVKFRDQMTVCPALANKTPQSSAHRPWAKAWGWVGQRMCSVAMARNINGSGSALCGQRDGWKTGHFEVSCVRAKGGRV
jgi:hypothetical protein